MGGEARRDPHHTVTDAACECSSWQGRHGSFMAIFPTELFLTLERQEAQLDLHGTIPHSGRVRCQRCGRNYRYDNSLLSGLSVELEP
jgi:hypothetical protein